MKDVIFYYNPKTWTISNRLGFIVYRACTEKDFKKAIRKYKAIKLEY